MKLLLLLPFLVASAFSANGNEKNVPPWPERWQLKQNAMTLMEDVVPQKPESDAMAKLFNDRGCAIWGKFFGDTQIGALVAVRPDKAKEFDDAYLCLLLWKGGWKFAQWIGKVQWTSGMTEWSPSETENWNWGIKRCLPDAPYYVISSLDVNAISYRDHFSWFCDPKTHSLQPTGWPKDAMPSLSGGTITFRRCEKSGYAPTVFEIDQFDGKPGKNLAIYTDKFEGGGQSFITVSMPVPTTGKRITWRIAPQPGNKFEAGDDRRSLCYSPLDGYLEPFREDATVDREKGSVPSINAFLHP